MELLSYLWTASCEANGMRKYYLGFCKRTKQFNIRALNCLRWCRFFSKHGSAFSKYSFQQH